jgi:hypothetical protein
MDNQYGGAKLKPEKSIAVKSVRGTIKTDTPKIIIKKDGFKPVYNMVNRVDSKLSLLTANSLKGFMINLTVNKQDTEYLNLRDRQFTYPVTNFILKFVIIRGTNDPILDSYNGIRKSFESRQSFFEEAKLQQLVWSKSIIDGKPAICPSVANLSMFDTINSENLMQFFLDKVNTEPTTTSSEPTATSTFEYLKKNSTIKDRGIGVLTMPAITQSTTIDRFLNLRDNSLFYGTVITHEIKSRAISSVFAQIARLFIDIGVVHLDLHPGNVMIYLDSDKTILKPDDKIKTLLIDFGRASNIMNETKDVFEIEEKIVALNVKNTYYYRFGEMNLSNSADEKRKYMENVLDTIANVDFSINQLHYRDGSRYQMMWYEQYRKYYLYENNVIRHEYKNLFVNAFDMLKNMMGANIDKPGIAPTTIKTYQRNGSFVNFNAPIEKFIVPFPGPVTHSAQTLPVPVGQIQYRVQMDTLPPPPAQMEPISPSATEESLQSSLSIDPSPPLAHAPPLDNNIGVDSLPSSADMESEDNNIGVDSSPSSVQATPLFPPIPPVGEVLRVQGGRKNKHHKTNKRKKCKSKRNRRNKTKNTRKKRKN